MRAFVAIPLPPDAQRRVAALIRDLERAGADVKWVAPAHLHLTLKFLGEITEEQRQSVETLVRRAAAREARFTMELAEVGAFPSARRPRIVWVGIGAGRDPAGRLAGAIEQGCLGLGIEPEEREFSAHVTIGRVRSPRGLSRLASRLQAADWRAPDGWTVGAVRLVRSVLDSSGPAYTTLAEIPLTATGAAG